MARGSATLAIKIVSDASQAAKELDKVSGSTGATGRKIAAAGKVAAVGLGALAAAGIGAARAAAEDARGQAILAQALHKSAGATEAQVAGTEAWIEAQGRALGVTDDQLRPALASLARATGDVGEAQKAAAVAMDVSAATGKDLGSVSGALAKAYAGNTASLGKLVPGMDKGVLASKDMAKITKELARLTGGTAAKAAETAAGKQQRMTVALDETYESIGAALLPALTVLANLLLRVAQWAQKNSTIFLILAGVIGTIAVAVIAANAALTIYNTVTAITAANAKRAAAGQWALNASLLANPVVLIVAGVIALVAALVIAYKKSETFRRIVDNAFRAVMSAARTVARVVGAVLSNVWRVIVAVARPIIWAITTYIRAWWTVAQLVARVLTVILGAAFRTLKAIAAPILSGLVSAFELVKKAVDPIVSVVETLIDLIGKIKIPKIPKIPGLSSVVTVAPAPSVATRGGGTRRGRASSRTAAGSSGGLTVNVNAPLDPQQTARAVQRLVHSADVRAGRVRFG